LLLSQILTLYTTPVIYIFFDNLASRFSRKKTKGERPGTREHGTREAERAELS
jgi:multidrug efflux pump